MAEGNSMASTLTETLEMTTVPGSSDTSTIEMTTVAGSPDLETIELTTVAGSSDTDNRTAGYMDMAEHIRRYYNVPPTPRPRPAPRANRRNIEVRQGRQGRRPHEESMRVPMPEPFYHSLLVPKMERALPSLPPIYREAGVIPGYEFLPGGGVKGRVTLNPATTDTC